MVDLKNLERLNPEVKKRLVPYLSEMIDLHKENLVSILLYGSALDDDFSFKSSDINLLVILKEVSFKSLKKSLKLVDRGIKKKITAPLFFSSDYLFSSADVFPMEFLDMQEKHLLLYGEDLFSRLEIDAKNLRLYCEEQIKGKLIRIRQAYLEIGLQRKGIELLLKESLKSLMPVFKNLLRIKGETPLPHLKEEILKRLGEVFQVESGVFLTVLRDTTMDEKIGGKEASEFLAEYLQVLTKLALAVDTL